MYCEKKEIKCMNQIFSNEVISPRKIIIYKKRKRKYLLGDEIGKPFLQNPEKKYFRIWRIFKVFTTTQLCHCRTEAALTVSMWLFLIKSHLKESTWTFSLMVIMSKSPESIWVWSWPQPWLQLPAHAGRQMWQLIWLSSCHAHGRPGLHSQLAALA